jgi:hypothetical protein
VTVTLRTAERPTAGTPRSTTRVSPGFSFPPLIRVSSTRTIGVDAMNAWGAHTWPKWMAELRQAMTPRHPTSHVPHLVKVTADYAADGARSVIVAQYKASAAIVSAWPRTRRSEAAPAGLPCWGPPLTRLRGTQTLCTHKTSRPIAGPYRDAPTACLGSKRGSKHDEGGPGGQPRPSRLPSGGKHIAVIQREPAPRRDPGGRSTRTASHSGS